MALIALALGAAVGVALHLIFPATFPWGFVVGAAIASLFALAAYMRRTRWEETGACAAIAAIAVFVPLFLNSLFFLVGAAAILVAYKVIADREAHKREQRRRGQRR